MVWTQERINLLIDLWMSGKSASAVAKEIGNISRNAVIGKVHRLGIARRSNTKSTKKTSDTHITTANPSTKTIKDISNFLRPAPEYIKIKTTKKAHPPRGYSTRNILPYHPDGKSNKKITLLELKEKSCRWPSGDPKTRDFSFCGCPTQDNMPYCDYHAHIAYATISKKDNKQHIIVERKGNTDPQDDASLDIGQISDHNSDTTHYIS